MHDQFMECLASHIKKHAEQIKIDPLEYSTPTFGFKSDLYQLRNEGLIKIINEHDGRIDILITEKGLTYAC